VLDEATGIPEPIFEQLVGTLTGICNLAIMIFNPIKRTGYAASTHLDLNVARDWVSIHWNAEDCERITKEHIDAEAQRFGGKDTDSYRIWVKGEFPTSDQGNRLISYDKCLEASKREIEPSMHDPVKIGIDPGAGGDNTAICVRRGQKVEWFKEVSEEDPIKVSDWCMDQILLAEEQYNGVDAIYCDKLGPAQGVYWELKRRVGKRVFYGVDSGAKASEERSFGWLRDELLWRVRLAFYDGDIQIPYDKGLIAELNLLSYEESGSRIKIETKRLLRARGKKSPNRLDALAMTYLNKDVSYNRKPSDGAYRKTYESVNQFVDQELAWMGL
jgi:hypothetical protein